MAGSGPRTDQSNPIDLVIVGGAGHVGLPLALVFADKGLRVMIHDVNERALGTIRGGQLPALENGAAPLLSRALENGRLAFSSDPGEISGKGALIITIGTPVDEFLNPSYTVIRECIDGLLPALSDGQLVVLRSTVYPGTTEWLDEYLKKKGITALVAFCPERVLQGHSIHELQTMPQIVSGTTRQAEDAAADLFGLIAPEVVRVKPIVAEFSKLFTNAHRYIQFATSNQFYMIAKAAGVDYDEILDAMTRNYPRTRDFPTAGFAAGPCLFKDTVQLCAFAGHQFSLGAAATQVNEGLVHFVISQLRRSHDLANATVGLLGMAFKADSDDTRSSLSYKLKKMLSLYAKNVLTTDPLVTDDPELHPLEKVIERSDVLILCTPHSAYKGLELEGKAVVDVWGFFNDVGQ